MKALLIFKNKSLGVEILVFTFFFQLQYEEVVNNLATEDYKSKHLDLADKFNSLVSERFITASKAFSLKSQSNCSLPLNLCIDMEVDFLSV